MTSKELDKQLTHMKNDIWADIERLSELRSNYNCSADQYSTRFS